MPRNKRNPRRYPQAMINALRNRIRAVKAQLGVQCDTIDWIEAEIESF